MTYNYSSSSDKYIAILVKSSINSTQGFFIYTIPDLLLVGDFPVLKVSSLEGKGIQKI